MSAWPEYSNPCLTEPGITYFLNESLKQCHVYRDNYYNTLINLGLFAGFLVLLGGILLYKYKNIIKYYSVQSILQTINHFMIFFVFYCF